MEATVEVMIMGEQQPPAGRQDNSDKEDWPAPDPEELRLVEEHLDQLEKEGVLIKGDGIRGSLKPVAYIPGAVERFMAERGSKPKPWRQQ